MLPIIFLTGQNASNKKLAFNFLRKKKQKKRGCNWGFATSLIFLIPKENRFGEKFSLVLNN